MIGWGRGRGQVGFLCLGILKSQLVSNKGNKNYVMQKQNLAKLPVIYAESFFRVKSKIMISITDKRNLAI